ncbi:MAG: S8 family serine peptidase [Proteobacteria bacterium]|nr:S8 family serine peptidase [Pseudomonadota bacterium]
MVVGVQGTGFLLSHPAFAGLRVLAQRDFVQGDLTTANEAGDPPGQHDHGTKVLSLLAGQEPGVFSGVAPEVTVLLAKIDDLSLNTQLEDDGWIAGLEWLEEQGADIVTSSILSCAGGGSGRPEFKHGATEPTSLAAARPP